MYEKHENEQYFFNKATLLYLADYAARYEMPCCLCAPLLGRELELRGVKVRTLDIDERFSALSGFRRFDI